MFTGIITDIGEITAITRGTGGEWGDTRMDVSCAYDVSSIDIGASIAHAGACMTVIEKGEHSYAFEVSDEKGSITIDGVSLTVNDVDGPEFEVNIIPHTWEVTTLGKLQIGSKVNLEIDLIARYVARYLKHQLEN